MPPFSLFFCLICYFYHFRKRRNRSRCRMYSYLSVRKTSAIKSWIPIKECESPSNAWSSTVQILNQTHMRTTSIVWHRWKYRGSSTSVVEDDISYTRGGIFSLERAWLVHFNESRAVFHVWQSLPNMVIKRFQIPIGNGHWESNFFNGYFSPIVVEIEVLQRVW